ncbi:hypothetical protein CYMTET_14497 [Cymbomonas tetramitiformis]|uniref:CBM-cenC domain-containing protein n=1 Tax=Cymbomonas tetramitiformis TaxID=36881 RepID=A0AAE0GFV2_9CHLO|nr:hypothetical protein CYMTET_14497 [Cymbomonas tetramitiformis]
MSAPAPDDPCTNRSIVQDSEFQTVATSPWEFRTRSSAVANATWGAFGEAGAAAVRLNVQSGGTAPWHVQLVQAALTLEPEVPYWLRIKARASRALRMKVKVKAVDGSVITQTTSQLAQAWEESWMQFYVEAQVQVDLRVFVGKESSGAVVDLDAIDIVAGCPPCHRSLVEAPNMSHEDAWELRTASSAEANATWGPFGEDGAEGARIRVQDGGQKRWHVQLRQDAILLEPGVMYQVAVKAKASSSVVSRILIKSEDESSAVISSLRSEIALTWGVATAEFQVDARVQAKLQVLFGRDSANTVIDFDTIDIFTECASLPSET